MGPRQYPRTFRLYLPSLHPQPLRAPSYRHRHLLPHAQACPGALRRYRFHPCLFYHLLLLRRQYAFIVVFKKQQADMVIAIARYLCKSEVVLNPH